MKIKLSISCVDGSSVYIETDNVIHAKKFLDENDHEGANCTLIIEEDQNVYSILDDILKRHNSAIKFVPKT